jgi:hypothetical protein
MALTCLKGTYSMRSIFAALILLLNSSHLLADATLKFGGFFSLTLPNEIMDGSKIASFSPAGLLIKTSEGSVISGSVIFSETVKLSKKIHINSYPEYLIGLKDHQDLTDSDKQIFEETKNSYRNNYNLSSYSILESNIYKVYSLSNNNSSIFFVTRKAEADYLLTLSFDNFEKNKAVEIIKAEYQVE